MNFSRFPVALAVLASSLIAISGCGGGWGDLKPTIASTGSSSSGSGTTGSTTQSGSSQLLTVLAGQPATFFVTPRGTGPFTFQWFLNGEAISGATSSTYTIPSTAAGQNGASFSVAVTNAAGTVTAGPYMLTVELPPTITQQPVNQTMPGGKPATFSVIATGTAPMNYQWMEDGAAIGGANASSLTTPSTSVSESGSTFSVTVGNAAGSVTISIATLKANPIVPALAFASV